MTHRRHLTLAFLAMTAITAACSDSQREKLRARDVEYPPDHLDGQREGQPSLFYFYFIGAEHTQDAIEIIRRLEPDYADRVFFSCLDSQRSRNLARLKAFGLNYHGIVLRDARGRPQWQTEKLTGFESQLRAELDSLLAESSG